MTRSAKVKLIIGLVILAIICLILYGYFSYSQVVVGARQAHIEAPTYTVGITYSGRVAKQFVQEGDRVQAGQKLFYIKSSDLVQQLNNGSITPKDVLYPLTSDHEIILEASQPGVVKSIAEPQGSFVQANSTVATLVNSKMLQVLADFQLSPQQFAQIGSQSRLVTTLPDGRQITEPLGDVTVQQKNGQSIAEITARLTHVDYSSLKAANGTPVTATLQITKGNFWTSIFQTLKGYL